MSIDIERILLEIELLPDESQVPLQGVEGIEDFFYGTGKLKYLNHKETDFIHPLYDLPYTNQIIKDLGMYRTRLMKMKPKTCYTYHRDPTKRIHIPLITNEKCMFIIDDIIYRYPADGKHYVLDTTKWHTAINASLEERTHIIGCIL
jgi:hypothetical protein